MLFSCGFGTKATSKSGHSNLAKVFSDPLIVGASVSANYGTTSPSLRAATRHTSAERVVTVAAGGTPGVRVLENVRDEVLDTRSVIIGMDLFFWDSALPSAQPTLAALRALLAKAQTRGIPVLMGDVPELLPGRQPSRDAINEAIRNYCQRARGCYLLQLDQLHAQVMRDGYLTVDGKRLAIHELVPDGLHLSVPAAEFLAGEIEKTLGNSRK